MDLESKQHQFNLAMQLYETKKRYKIFGLIVSFCNVLFQFLLLCQILTHSIGWVRQLLAIIIAFLLADFINGLVHMYMDNNENYNSYAGPLIANFHLHHRTPRYKDKNLFLLYFIETGAKIWLLFYLIAVACLLLFFDPNSDLLYILTYTGILSSLAEVSHYLCHNSQSELVNFLARLKLCLSKQQHALHHREDNTSYTFLNGITDPLVNRIAKKYYDGYKNRSDLHYSKYKPVH